MSSSAQKAAGDRWPWNMKSEDVDGKVTRKATESNIVQGRANASLPALVKNCQGRSCHGDGVVIVQPVVCVNMSCKIA